MASTGLSWDARIAGTIVAKREIAMLPVTMMPMSVASRAIGNLSTKYTSAGISMISNLFNAKDVTTPKRSPSVVPRIPIPIPCNKNRITTVEGIFSNTIKVLLNAGGNIHEIIIQYTNRYLKRLNMFLLISKDFYNS